MSRENVEMLRRAYAAFSERDVEGALQDISPEATYVTTGLPGQPKVVRGPEGYREAFGWLLDMFDDWTLAAREFIDAGDKVATEFTLSGRGHQSGIESSITFWQVWTVRDGKFVHGQGFTSREKALAAAGLQSRRADLNR